MFQRMFAPILKNYLNSFYAAQYRLFVNDSCLRISNNNNWKLFFTLRFKITTMGNILSHPAHHASSQDVYAYK